MIDHPFLKRIRLEREVIKVTNQRYDLFGSKLNGLSQKTINNWYNKAIEYTNIDNCIVDQVKLKLDLIGKVIKAESGCSHRGAMIATLPSFDVATIEIQNLKNLISKTHFSVGSV